MEIYIIAGKLKLPFSRGIRIPKILLTLCKEQIKKYLGQ